MIAIRRVLACGGVAATLGACTVGSPTYISAQESPSTEDAGASGAAGGAGANGAGGDGGATCAGDDFAKPDLSALTACGDGKGHCYDKTKAPLADQLVPCADAAQVCVPDEILAAGGAPLKACTSIIGPGGCVTTALFPAIEEQGGGALKQDVCAAGQKCVPCTDPTHGDAPTPFCQPIGVHEKSCVAGAAPGGDGGAAPAAQRCCTKKGKSNGTCVSETAIPEAQRSKTKQDTCADGDKCVPTAFVEGAPVACDGGAFGRGVCMDRCFDTLMGIAGDIGILTTKGCGDTEVCVPCSFVKGSGAPGCT